MHDPHLDTDGTINGLCDSSGIIDVSTESVQRHAAFGILFNAGNFGTTEAATALHLDSFHTHAHSALDGTLHGAAERNTLFQLASDVFGHELGVRFGAADFVDVDIDFLAGEELKFALEAFQLFALLTNHDTRAGSVEVHANLLDSAFDAHLGEGGVFEALHEVATKNDVFVKKIGKLVFGIPLGFPAADNAKTKTIRMSFLTHCNYSLLATTTVM